MSDGITDAKNTLKEQEEWDEQTSPYIEKKILGKKPEELTPHQNHLIYLYYRAKSEKLKTEIDDVYGMMNRKYWDAYIGQGEYRHTRKGTVRKKK